MFSLLTNFLVLISMLLNYGASIGVFNIPSISTSCENYVHVKYNWNDFPLCYVQRIKVPINNTAVPFNCSYWQAYRLIDINNVASLQTLFPNQNLTGITTDNVGVTYLTYQNLKGNSITETSIWVSTTQGEVYSVQNSTNFIQTEVIVFNSSVGYVRIECPMGTFDNISTVLCSLPNKISVCTYNRNATDSDIQSLITGGINVEANMQSLGIVNQTNCPKPIYQNTPIAIPL